MPDVKFSNQYPYTDFHELNLDWVIKEVKFWSERVGKSIQTITKTGTVGLVDTYTITYSDNTTSTFDVTNGNGIASVAKTGTVGLVDTYTITFQDGSTSTFEVHNGTASIDDTLTLSGWAADAQMVGNLVKYAANNQIYPATPQTAIANNGATATLTQQYYTDTDSLIIPCVPGDVFTITGEGFFNYRLWAFCGPETGGSYPVISKSEANAAADKVIITAPAGSAYLTVNFSRNYITYAGMIISGRTVDQRIAAAAKNTVSVAGDSVTIKLNQYSVLMQKTGNNNLMNLRAIYDASGTLLHTATSDWQGPYEITALQNADGDAISDGICFTGGNHAYSHDGLSGLPTARTLSFKVIADGVEVSDGQTVNWSNNVTVLWINRVQGWNTKKSDGSGREILEETPVWTFYPDGRINASNTFSALEDINVDLYYGLQMMAGWIDQGIFIPTASREIESINNFTAGDLGYVFAGTVITACDSHVNIKMGFDHFVDLGSGDEIHNAIFNEKRLKAVGEGTKKCYIYMVVNSPLNANEQMEYRGFYLLEKP